MKLPRFVSSLLSSPVGRAVLALVGMLVLGAIFNADGAFFHWTTHRDMLRQLSVYGMLACGMTLVIITSGIDLSVSSVLAACAVGFSLMTIHMQMNPWVAIVAVLLGGTAVGAVSGVFVGRFKIQPFVVTLAAMVLLRGLAKHLSGGQKISTYIADADKTVTLPPIFERIDARVLGDNIAIVTLIFLFCVLVSAILLRHSRLGRYFYATGGNAEAARLSGVPVTRTLILAYALSGLFSAIAGVCQAAQEQQGDPETGMGYELQAIAIVVIGGTNLAGGRGGMGLTLVGALTIGYLQKILSINAVGEASRLMLTGAIIVCAVLLQRRK
ncbi:ABC transporter permease [Pendulispora rubella]|uniref:ABC transporter permease n=1 Tax=Pendulispora rubella TaxID=2741070 RepID=A0ABZ2KSE1_9BACT